VTGHSRNPGFVCLNRTDEMPVWLTFKFAAVDNMHLFARSQNHKFERPTYRLLPIPRNLAINHQASSPPSCCLSHVKKQPVFRKFRKARKTRFPDDFSVMATATTENMPQHQP
jgi:hypothetical protein